ncbi:MAG: hypothetical protein N3B16_12900 [Candidatus Aminicenantes bacterium]|nr:hypothetical protein [Candidatus Aminicenantes bacterium]
MEQNLIYKAEPKVHSSAVDFRGKASLRTLVNYLQDSIGTQAQELGLTLEPCPSLEERKIGQLNFLPWFKKINWIKKK